MRVCEQTQGVRFPGVKAWIKKQILHLALFSRFVINDSNYKNCQNHMITSSSKSVCLVTSSVIFVLNQTFARLVWCDGKASKDVYFDLKDNKPRPFKSFHSHFPFKQVKRSTKVHQHIHFCQVRKALSYDVQIVKIAYVV